MEKPFSQAAFNNRSAILERLLPLFQSTHSVLEVGSGTGQHAVYFSQHMPHLQWQTGDLKENHSGIQQWLDDEGGENCLPPVELDVTQQHWPDQQYDAIYTANTFHIIPWPLVELFFQRIENILAPKAKLVVYGPFNYEGSYTSDSNANFDQWLKETDPDRGIRDIEDVNELAKNIGLQWLHDYEMPANNRLQVWELTDK